MSDFFNRTLDTMREGPLGPVIRWIEEHPRLSAFIVLGLGMVILVGVAGQSVGLTPGQWVAIVIATLLVAAACVWIISWEDEDEEPEVKAEAEKPSVTASAAEPTKKDSVKATGTRPAAKKGTAARRSPTKPKSTKKTGK